MYLKSIKFENYKGIKDSGEIVFNEHINILCGKNNSGKTSILEGIKDLIFSQIESSRITGEMPSKLYKGSSSNEIIFKLTFLPQENNLIEKLGLSDLKDAKDKASSYINLFSEFFTINQNGFFIGYPWDISIEVNCSMSVSKLRNGSSYKFNIGWINLTKKNDFLNFLYQDKESMNLAFNISGNKGESCCDPSSLKLFTEHLTFKNFVETFWMDNIYFFNAHRESNREEWVNIKESPKINPDFSNYKETLHTIYNNFPEKFDLIQKEVAFIFPEVERIITKIQDNRTNVFIKSKKNSYEVGINDMGTGFEQSLGLITAIITANKKSIFLIDEPHVFLHPEAERKLLDFLKRYPEHQYILSTHSPIMLNSVDVNAVHLVQKSEDDVLTVKNINSSCKFEVSELINELDFKPSDFWFNDAFIWVEGETEEKVINFIIEKMLPSSKKNIKVKKVPCTSDIRKEVIKRTQQMYLHMKDIQNCFNAPFIFILDREEKSAKDIEDLTREFQANNIPIHFLNKREIENYFLQADLIQDVLKLISKEVDISYNLPRISIEDIGAQLSEILSNYEDSGIYKGDKPENKEEELVLCKGSAVLDRLFNRYLGSEYRKTAYGELFASVIIEKQPAIFDELINFIKEQLT